MGLLVSSSTAGSPSAKAVLALPAGHSWQRNAELQLGGRTGYCGTFTTFSGMASEATQVGILVNGWMNWLGGIFVTIACSGAAFAMGMHVAMLADKYDKG